MKTKPIFHFVCKVGEKVHFQYTNCFTSEGSKLKKTKKKKDFFNNSNKIVLIDMKSLKVIRKALCITSYEIIKIIYKS